MITQGDDYPIHQTAEPIAYSGTDRNFYDRYFFSGYTHDGGVFFALAFGIYPHLNVKDAAFCVVLDGVQHNLRASVELHMERMMLTVGPISLEVVVPLEVLRIRVDDTASGIRADLTFRQRGAVIEEPRFVRRIGPRTHMDYTRMTQAGSYQGFIEVGGKRVSVDHENCLGTRDRSWGVRQVGTRDPQPTIPSPEIQFYWLWAPLNFDGFSTLFGLNEDVDGKAWHRNMKLIPRDRAAAVESFAQASVALNYLEGSRHLAATELRCGNHGEDDVVIRIQPRFNFYMSGLGYLHPVWGHGMYHGGDVCAYDTIELAGVSDSSNVLHRHIQAFVDVVMQRNGVEYKGVGVLEQMVLGRHNPSRFTDDPVFGVGGKL